MKRWRPTIRYCRPNEWTRHPSQRYTRVCTVCFQQPALPDTTSDRAVGPENPEKPLTVFQESDDGSKSDSGDGEELDSDKNDAKESDEDVRKPAWTVVPLAALDDGSVGDPFVLAIGGVQNLLVGKAYQTNLLVVIVKVAGNIVLALELVLRSFGESRIGSMTGICDAWNMQRQDDDPRVASIE
jgi:hypothetical protein